MFGSTLNWIIIISEIMLILYQVSMHLQGLQIKPNTTYGFTQRIYWCFQKSYRGRNHYDNHSLTYLYGTLRE